jgi:hypothetical protein
MILHFEKALMANRYSRSQCSLMVGNTNFIPHLHGNKTFICPVRSLALSHAEDGAVKGDAPTEWF